MPRSDTPGRVRRGAARSTVTLALVLAGLAAAPEPARAATVSIGGYVFHDLDADGHRDPGEPGLPGLRVNHSTGAPVTTTDAAGHYLLTDLPGTGKLQIQAGWLRSQCYDPIVQDCPAGPGDDNDVPTRNQFFEYPLAGKSSADDVNLGLLPDWPGPGMAPPDPVGGVTPANEIDIAARLSAGADTCSPDAFSICAAGDTFQQYGQVYNQGTRPITGLRAKILVPPGDCVTGLTVIDFATSPDVGPMRTMPAPEDFSCDTREVEVSFPGTLVPAGAVRLSVTGTVADGPGTPGCTLTATPAATCGTGAPQGRTLMIGVSHIDQEGDPDSDFCARHDLGACPTGLHDKRREPDEVDPAGHNVDAALGGTTDFNLRMSYARVRLPGQATPLAAPGEAITVRGWVRNQIGVAEPTNQAHAGATVRFFFPTGTEIVALPAPHALRECATDPGGTSVTCVYHSPLAPYVASIALDLVVRVPAGWPVGRPYRTVACVSPVAGQPGERVPSSAEPCGPETRPELTATDNDAGLFLIAMPRPA